VVAALDCWEEVMLRDIERVIDALGRRNPRIWWERLEVTHTGDDDGLWFFRETSESLDVQLESPNGMVPFLFESPNQRKMAETVEEAVELVLGGLEGLRMGPNYMIKPTAEQALRINRGPARRCGLSLR